MRGSPEYRGWDIDRYLLAAVVDAIQQNTHAFVSANSKQKPKPPEPVPRPGKDGKKGPPKSQQFAAQAAMHLAAARRARGG